MAPRRGCSGGVDHQHAARADGVGIAGTSLGARRRGAEKRQTKRYYDNDTHANLSRSRIILEFGGTAALYRHTTGGQFKVALTVNGARDLSATVAY